MWFECTREWRECCLNVPESGRNVVEDVSESGGNVPE